MEYIIFYKICGHEASIKILKKIIRKLLNNVGIRCFGISYDLYVAARTYRSFDSMALLLSWMVGSAKVYDRDFSLAGKRVLEIGSGIFFSHALGLKILGAQSVLSIDKYPQLHTKASKLALRHSFHAKKALANETAPDVPKILNKILGTHESNLLSRLEDLGISFKMPCSVEELSEQSGVYDLIFSYTVLEHIPEEDLDTFLKSSIKLLAPNGYFLHFIDLEDHLDSERPFDFLTLKDWDTQDCYLRGNRLRMSSWESKFKSFDQIRSTIISKVKRSLSVEVNLVDSKIKYKDLDDLQTTGLLFLGKKMETK